MSEWAIRSERLGKEYRSGVIRRKRFRALDNISLGVRPGRIFGLLGPNGAGKTTFVKILLGVIRRSEGGAEVLGHDAGSRECRRRIGYLPEQMRVPRHLSGIGALQFYGGLSGLSKSEVRERSGELFRRVGLAGREGDRTRQYSKGMVQRLGLAQALLHRPPLLILDEPTDGLDPRARAEMRLLLQELRERDGVTIFLNSHILQEVEMVCDEVAIMHRGRLRFAGPVSEIESRLAGGGAARLRVRFSLLGDDRIASEVFRDEPSAVFGGAVTEMTARVGEGERPPLQVDVEVPDQHHIDRLVDALRAAGLSLVRLERSRVSLEDAFMQFTSGEEGGR